MIFYFVVNENLKKNKPVFISVAQKSYDKIQ